MPWGVPTRISCALALGGLAGRVGAAGRGLAGLLGRFADASGRGAEPADGGAHALLGAAERIARLPALPRAGGLRAGRGRRRALLVALAGGSGLLCRGRPV